VYQTAVQYHFWHALGLLAVGILLLHKPESGALVAAAWLARGRIVLFSGSPLLHGAHRRARTGRGDADRRRAFLAAWAAVACAAWRW
jgi:hypothetical protein